MGGRSQASQKKREKQREGGSEGRRAKGENILDEHIKKAAGVLQETVHGNSEKESLGFVPVSLRPMVPFGLQCRKSLSVS